MQLPVNALVSILHRISGIVLILLWPMAAMALAVLASGPDWYNWYVSILATPLGRLMLMGWLWAIGYHWLAGCKHLYEDMMVGHGWRTHRRHAVVVLGMFVIYAALIVWQVWWRW